MRGHATIDAAAPAQEVAAATVKGLAAEMLPNARALAVEMNTHLVATMPELSAGDDDLREETRASCEANITQVFQLLKLGVGADAMVIPVEAAAWVRGLLVRGITVTALLRSYRLGHAWLWEHWSQALQERIDDPEALAAARDHTLTFMFTYVDKISDVLVTEYGTERDRMMRGAQQLRTETTRALLTGDTLDEEVAVGRLGYELRRHHVALRVWSNVSELRGLERAASEAAAVLGPAAPLVVASGVASFDVWCGSFVPPADAVLESTRAWLRAGRRAHGAGGRRHRCGPSWRTLGGSTARYALCSGSGRFSPGQAPMKYWNERWPKRSNSARDGEDRRLQRGRGDHLGKRRRLGLRRRRIVLVDLRPHGVECLAADDAGDDAKDDPERLVEELHLRRESTPIDPLSPR